MTTDIRLNVNFFDHPKTVKLKSRLGLEGVVSLIKLWMWSARNRPNGTLSNMDIEDIEIAAGWQNKPGLFHSTLVTLRWLDIMNIDDQEVYQLHDWQDHNEWVADAINRGDRARFSRMASTHPNIYAQLTAQGHDSITRDEYLTLTKRQRDNNDVTTDVNASSTPPPSPSPSPSPAPVIKNDQDDRQNKLERKKQAEKEFLYRTAKMTADLLPKFNNDPPREDDVDWIMGLYENPENRGLNIHSEIVNALKWTTRKKFQVKNTRAYINEWLKKQREALIRKENAKGETK